MGPCLGNGTLLGKRDPGPAHALDSLQKKSADLSCASDYHLCQLFQEQVFFFFLTEADQILVAGLGHLPDLTITSAAENRLHSLDHTDTTEIFTRLLAHETELSTQEKGKGHGTCEDIQHVTPLREFYFWLSGGAATNPI